MPINTVDLRYWWKMEEKFKKIQGGIFGLDYYVEKLWHGIVA